MACFVREMATPQQARTEGSLFEPSAHAPVDMHHNSPAPRMARIIVPVRCWLKTIRIRYRPIGKAALSHAAERLLRTSHSNWGRHDDVSGKCERRPPRGDRGRRLWRAAMRADAQRRT